MTWQIGNCEECGCALFATDEEAQRMTLPVRGVKCVGCKERLRTITTRNAPKPKRGKAGA